MGRKPKAKKLRKLKKGRKNEFSCYSCDKKILQMIVENLYQKSSWKEET
jgi:PP-loop superfamily ATP-utilizing enzyme